MSYVKNYDVGITRIDNTYKHYVHELPLLSFGDARNTFNLSLVFHSGLTSNPFHIANGYKLNIQKRIIFAGNVPQSYEDGYGTLVTLNKFGDKYAFDDGSQRIIRFTGEEYVLENPDYSTETFDQSGNILLVKDKYSNTILSYVYYSGKLVLVTYKGKKSLIIGYSNNAIAHINYTHSNSTFRTTFSHSDNSLTVSHYSGVDYHFEYSIEQTTDIDNSVYTEKSLKVYSTNPEEEFSDIFSHKNIATKESGSITIENFIGNKEIDRMCYDIFTYDSNNNVKLLNIHDSNHVDTFVVFENGKPAYSYEYLGEGEMNNMFVQNSPDSTKHYIGKMTFHDNEHVARYQDYDASYTMILNNIDTSMSSYLLDYEFSGMITLSGWVKAPEDNISQCTVCISGTDNNIKHSYTITGLRKGIWTYFSTSFDMEGDNVIHARILINQNDLETCDFRISGKKVNTSGTDDSEDHAIKSTDVIIYTDSNGTEYPIDITEVTAFINGNSSLNKETYPIKIKDLIRFKINQKFGTNTGEIYYNNGRGILTLSDEFYVRFNLPDGTSVTARVEDIAVGNLYNSRSNKYVTKINSDNINGSERIIIEYTKNNSKIKSEIYDSNIDLIESTSGNVRTSYIRNENNGLVETQKIKDTINSDEITFSYEYDENDFLVSTRDEFGVVTRYTTDAAWGVTTRSSISGGTTTVDSFDDDCCTQTSRKFDSFTNARKHTFTYGNGFLTGIEGDILTYTMGYNSGTLSSIEKNDHVIAEFSKEDYNRYSGRSVSEYYPNETNTDHSIIALYNKYGRLVEIEEILKNTYDIAPTYSDGAYHTLGIEDGNSKLAASEDLITGNTTKFAYENNLLTQIDEFDSNNTNVKSETLTYQDDGKLMSDKLVYDTNGNYVQYDISYRSESAQYGRGMVSSFSNKINGVEKSKSQTNYNYCNLAELKRHTVGGQVFEQEIHYDKTRPSIIYDLKGTVPDVDVLMTTYYDYDDMGRVTEIYNDGHISYEYDSYGQIIRENNSALDKTFAYEYNDIGNIVNVKEYEYTTEDYDLTYTEKTYTYDASLPDRLTSFNGSTITYNAIGCPTSFDGYSASWTRGKLASLSKSGSQISYDYNAFGQRIGKTYSGSTDYRCEFCYDESGRLVCETKYSDSGSVIDKIIYLYDVNSIIGMVHTLNGVESTYYFQRNLFGDVIGIYNTNGVKVGSYAYDAWGNHTVTLDTNGIATRNPIRYRGYYYDTETKLYYLNARYYNPEWRRFISPDDTAYLDTESVNGLNLYCYCGNDPVNYADPSGHWIETVFDLFSLGVSVIEVVINPADPLAWAGLAGDALDLIPFLTGVGETIKGVRVVAKGVDVADDAMDTIRFMKAVDRAEDFADGGLNIAKALDRTSDGFTISNRLDGIRIHSSFMGNGKIIPGSKLRLDGINDITKTIYELKPYNRVNLRKGVRQILNYNNELGGLYKMMIVFY